MTTETQPRSLQERVDELEKKVAWMEKLLATWVTGPKRPLIDRWQPDPRPASPAASAHTGRPVRGPRIGRRVQEEGRPTELL